MTRQHFKLVADVPVERLLLDHHNARIRSGADQADCIARILRKQKQLVALASDIAEKGLSTAPILVEPVDKKRFKVWDGNRRVTALKLLNNPLLCPVTTVRHQLEAIKKRAATKIPASIDVLASTSKDALLAEVLQRHGGQRDGVGQMNWSAFLRTVFLLGHDQPAADKRAGQLFLWGEEHGVDVDDEFPITSITRFLSKENLKALGFNVADSGVEPIIDTDKAIAVVQALASDFAPGGRKSVDDVFKPQDQQAYISQLRASVGLKDAETPGSKAHGSGTADAKPRAGRGNRSSDSDVDSDDGATDNGGEQKGAPKRGPAKPSWDRKFLFSRTGVPGFTIPDTQTKATNIVAELRKLDPNKTPIAVAALFRMLVEFSTKYYLYKHRAVPREKKMHLQIAKVAEHMRQAGKLDEGELKAVLRRTRENDGLLNYETLNAYIHALKAHPTGQGLNTLWDEIDSYVKGCWSN